MKKIVALMTLLALLLGLPPVSASIYDPNACNMFIKRENGQPVDMYLEPITDAEVIIAIPYGETVLVYSDFISNLRIPVFT